MKPQRIEVPDSATVCAHHPDRETRLACMKHEVYLCEECQRCRDPEIYCKFRTACPIWFATRKQRRQAKAAAGAA